MQYSSLVGCLGMGMILAATSAQSASIPGDAEAATHGDEAAGDGIYSIELSFPVGTVLEYKYTNSGPSGEWNPGEEFPSSNRRIVLDGKNEKEILTDVFGRL